MRAMKNSGIKWIGEIPKEWEVTKTLYLLSIPITDGPHTTPNFYDFGIPFVSAEAVSCGNGRIDFSHIRGYISEEFYDECCKKYVPQINDIYMIKSGATTGCVAIVDTDKKFTIWSPLAVFRANSKFMVAKFLFYTLQSDYYQKQVEQKWSYGTQQNIGMRVLESLKILFPPLSEQTAIASYLDKKCSNIDAIITKNEQIIEKLKEYKSSLISEAVTKGLNPDAEMKDSGVEWIGEIPAEWKIVKVKYTGYFENGLTYSPNDITDETGILVLRSSNIQSGNLDFNDCIYVFSAPEDLMVKRGDIIICSRNGSVNLVGKSVYIDNDIVATFGAFMMRYRTKIFDKFAFYMLQHVISYYKSFFATSTINQLTIKTIRQMVVALPSKSEQTAIANYLDEKCSIIDANIKKREIIIEKLAEYKKSLIYEVVTGKKEII